jgi:hypothetical protein
VNQLQYDSHGADASCFLAQLALPSPGRHPAHEFTPSRRGSMHQKIDHVPTVRRASAIRKELVLQLQLRLQQLEVRVA